MQITWSEKCSSRSVLMSPLSLIGISLDLSVLREPAIFTAIITEEVSEVGKGRSTTNFVNVKEHNLQFITFYYKIFTFWFF